MFSQEIELSKSSRESSLEVYIGVGKERQQSWLFFLTSNPMHPEDADNILAARTGDNNAAKADDQVGD